MSKQPPNKSIYNTNFAKAQYSLNLTKAREYIQANLQLIRESPTQYSTDAMAVMEFFLSVNDQQIKDRSYEVKKIYEQAEGLYLDEKYEQANGLLGFASILVEKSGLVAWDQSIQFLRKKIQRCLGLTEELEKLRIQNPAELAPIMLQSRFNKLESLWIETQEETGKLDAIHPNLVKVLTQLRDEVLEFMTEHGISRQDLQASGWETAKTTLDLISKDLRLSHLITGAKKNRILPEAKKELEKAYKLMQENPTYFSMEKQQELVNLIAEYDSRIENSMNDIDKIIQNARELMDTFEFSKAVGMLESYIEDLKLTGYHNLIPKIHESQEMAEINEIIYNNLLEIEKIYAQKDIMGAKMAFLHLRDQIHAKSQDSLILPTVQHKINAIEQKISGSTGISSLGQTTFDPFEEIAVESTDSSIDSLFQKFKQILIDKECIEKPELALLLQISEEKLIDYLIHWKRLVDFDLQGNYILFGEEKQKKARELSEEEKEQAAHAQETVKEKDLATIEKERKEKDALDALEELMKDDE